ncbi:hypothetical protein K0M31_018746 [Melipona bicolor]|uniref:Uncharacterized protein n=1 Tax=Melipona bicolor TaxID=60889 RepID=A0AA40KS82_9HYME|nr:hypothetical protein K0M31_018746 [Melipona bicolor]
MILREEEEEEEKKRKFENYKRARFDRLESGGEKNSWSHGHWVRCEWTRTRRKEPPQWWGGAIIAMNYNEPVESDSLRCSSRCNSIKVFFSGLLVARRNSREPSSSSGKRGGGEPTEAAAYESSVHAGKMHRGRDNTRRTRGLSFVATANLTREF